MGRGADLKSGAEQRGGAPLRPFRGGGRALSRQPWPPIRRLLPAQRMEGAVARPRDAAFGGSASQSGEGMPKKEGGGP